MKPRLNRPIRHPNFVRATAIVVIDLVLKRHNAIVIALASQSAEGDERSAIMGELSARRSVGADGRRCGCTCASLAVGGGAPVWIAYRLRAGGNG
jgi:hypothetical protein